jgi:23S rRNA pseudouridine2605 synthase
VFVPKVRKQRRSLLETANAPATPEQRPARAPTANRRIRQESDLLQASRQNARLNTGAKKRSDRGRG